MDAAEEKEKNEEEIGNVENEYSDDSLENEDEDDDTDEEEESHSQEPLTEEELEELIAELLEVESKAAEAQEALEEESLVKVQADVRKELAQSLSGDKLEKAVVEEMLTFKEDWELVLDKLETESAHLLEQLDGAGVELSSLYKCIERQVPIGCCTEAWKTRTHWVGTQISLDATKSVAQAEEYLKIHRPVRRRHGKILGEGAGGFLGKKIAKYDSSVTVNESTATDWVSFSKMSFERSSLEDITFSSKHWASVYLASTPQQAAELGLKFAGVDEITGQVEEIDDVGTSSDPFVADAIANERDLSLTEEQRRNFRKVRQGTTACQSYCSATGDILN